MVLVRIKGRNLTKLINSNNLVKSGLNDQLLNKITAIIINHKPVDKIVLFGSRARNRNQGTSDIDIAIYSSEWTSTDINLVHDKLEENISTALQFDLLHYNTLHNDNLKKQIEKGISLYYAR